MGLMLLWALHGLALLLTVATFTACIGRLEGRRPKWICFVLLLAFGLTYVGGLAIWTSLVRFVIGIPTMPFDFPAITLGLFLLYAVWLTSTIVKCSTTTSAAPKSAAWPRGRLAIGATCALAAFVLTYGLLDADTIERLESVRSEANEKVQSLLPPRPDDADNAAKIYVELEIDDDDLSDEAAEVLAGERPLQECEAEIREHLAKHQDALEKLRTAARLPACFFERSYHKGALLLDLSEMDPLLSGMRLLGFSAQRSIAEGNFPAAIQDIDTIYRLAEHVADHAPIIPVLIAVTIQDLGDRAVLKLLNDQSITANILKLLDTNPRPSFASAYQHAMLMEEPLIVITICSVLDPVTGDFLQALSAPNRPDAQRRMNPSQSLFRMFLADGEISFYRKAIHRIQSLTSQPPYEAREEMDQFMEETVYSKRLGILSALLLPAIVPLHESMYKADVQSDLLRIAVAARRYQLSRNQLSPNQLSQGELPTTLDQLVPEWIDAIPIDPFDGKPLKLQQDENSWTVYSIVRDEHESEDEDEEGDRDGEITIDKH